MNIGDAFKSLVNKELEPHNLTYEDVLNTKDWFKIYTTTDEEVEQFREWGISFLRKELGWSKRRAEKEMSWFILSYGLRVVEQQEENK